MSEVQLLFLKSVRSAVEVDQGEFFWLILLVNDVMDSGILSAEFYLHFTLMSEAGVYFYSFSPTAKLCYGVFSPD